MQKPLIEVEQLTTEFMTTRGYLRAVDALSFCLYEGEVLGLVGESGCGKSVSMLSLMRLLPPRISWISSGSVRFRGENLLEKSEAEMQRIRGKEISMIFQEPMTSLNPVFSVGRQIEEMFETHSALNHRERKERSIGLLERVGIPRPEKVYSEYPHQLSGGMRQRVMIAMALACQPQVLIADEPTTALDVTIQAQILDLMKNLIAEERTSILFITHDLAVIGEMANRVAVLYAGKIVEEAPVELIFDRPLHYYTQGLLASRPALLAKGDELICIDGTVPALGQRPAGCAFAPRCPGAMKICHERMPALAAVGAKHKVRCWARHDLAEGIEICASSGEVKSASNSVAKSSSSSVASSPPNRTTNGISSGAAGRGEKP